MFAKDGFQIIEGVLSEAECDRLSEHLCTDESRAGFRHLMSDPFVLALAFDERLKAITTNISGRPLIPYKATLFQKTGKANWLVPWHQDTTLPLESPPEGDGWGPSSVKDGISFAHAPTLALSNILALRVHLDASTRQNGPLKVIPGSHHERIVDDGEFGEWAKKDSSVCLVGKGGVIAISPLLVHASSKCTDNQPRRVLHIEYATEIEIANGVKLAIA